MTLRFICAESKGCTFKFASLRFQRSGIGTASAELLLARMQASVDALCIKRDKLVGERRIVPLCTRDCDVIH